MRKLILLILVTLKSVAIGAFTETYICTGSEETYDCKLYTGGDLIVYTYPERYYQDSSSVYESSDAAADYSPDDEIDDEEIARIESNDSIPQFNPPTYLNPFTGTFFIPVQIKK